MLIVALHYALAYMFVPGKTMFQSVYFPTFAVLWAVAAFYVQKFVSDFEANLSTYEAIPLS